MKTKLLMGVGLMVVAAAGLRAEKAAPPAEGSLVQIHNRAFGELLRPRNASKKDAKPYWVCEVVDADGSCRWIITQPGRRDIPLYWAERAHIYLKDDQHLEKSEFDRALRLIWTIREMAALNGHPFPETQREKEVRDAKEKSEAKPADPPEPAPAPPASETTAV